MGAQVSRRRKKPRRRRPVYSPVFARPLRAKHRNFPTQTLAVETALDLVVSVSILQGILETKTARFKQNGRTVERLALTDPEVGHALLDFCAAMGRFVSLHTPAAPDERPPRLPPAELPDPRRVAPAREAPDIDEEDD